MRCLYCDKELGQGSLRDIFIGEDPLCYACRKKWQKEPIHFLLEGIEVDADYLYEEAFSSCLIQYKECYDEAFKDAFLFEVKKKLRRRYRGYTLCMMPSSQHKYEERGFSHLYEMFRCIGLPILEPFVKASDISQKGKGKKNRMDMKDAIRCTQSLPEKIVLCDDTITTGATLCGALSQIDRQKHKIRIYCVSANRKWYDKLQEQNFEKCPKCSIR